MRSPCGAPRRSIKIRCRICLPLSLFLSRKTGPNSIFATYFPGPSCPLKKKKEEEKNKEKNQVAPTKASMTKRDKSWKLTTEEREEDEAHAHADNALPIDKSLGSFSKPDVHVISYPDIRSLSLSFCWRILRCTIARATSPMTESIFSAFSFWFLFRVLQFYVLDDARCSFIA